MDKKRGGFVPICAQDDELLGGAPPPSVRVVEVVYELFSFLIEHSGLLSIPGKVGVPDSPEAASVGDLVDFIFGEKLTVFFGEPGCVLDDSAGHIDDVNRSVRTHVGGDGTEVEVG